MNKINKIMKVLTLSAFAVLIFAGPSFASFSECFGPQTKYPGLSLSQDANDFPIRCTVAEDSNGDQVTIYGKDSAACLEAGTVVSNPDLCEVRSLDEVVRTIINTIIFVVGMLAVVMIIIGGINYTMSQGDPQKVSKAKSTIMFGIVGLVVCLLAFAIVKFVINAIRK